MSRRLPVPADRVPVAGLRVDLASGYLRNSTQLKVATYPVEAVGKQLFIVIDDSAP